MTEAHAARLATPTLRSIARAAPREYGVADAQITFLGGGKQPVFRVRVFSDNAAPTGEDRYTRNTFLLRIFPDGSRTTASIRSELQWLRAILSDTPIVVPEPVLTLGGDSVATVSLPDETAISHCALTRWVKGRFFLRPGGPG